MQTRHHNKLRWNVQSVRSLLRPAAVCAMVPCLASTAIAQSVCLPLPRLLTTMPMGGRAGSQVEITITGENLDDASELHFTHPSLTATRNRDASGQPEPNNSQQNKFIVTIGSDCPPGLDEVRECNALRHFVGPSLLGRHVARALPAAPHTTPAAAMELQVNSVCNAVATAKAIDYYAFEAQAGHRYVVHCASRGIDSQLDPVLIITDAAGHDLAVEAEMKRSTLRLRRAKDI